VSLAQSGEGTPLELHDGVRLRREVGGFPAGTEGAIIQVFPEQHAYGVELFESHGRTIGLVDASDLPRERAGCIWVARRRRPLGRLRKIPATELWS
jgi:hypothetical protein